MGFVFADSVRFTRNALQIIKNKFFWMNLHMFLHVEYVIIHKKKNIYILMDYPLPNKISDYLLCTSILIGLTALITFYNKDYITSILVFSLFLTSINFWRNPQYGIRRTIDMTLCKIICLFFLVSCLYFHEFNRTRRNIIPND